jgi:hypothetical protein
MTLTTAGRIRWIVLLPLVGPLFLVRKIFKGKSEQEMRTADKAHQATVRRELRGLPGKHDQSSFQP